MPESASPSSLILRPVGLDPGFVVCFYVFIFRDVFHLPALQGSTESNATNEEEEMKGRKGTRLIYFLFPVLIRSLFLSPIY